MFRWRGWIAWTIVAYLLAAALFELVLALRHNPSPDGEWVIRLVALVAMLVGAVVVYRNGGAAARIVRRIRAASSPGQSWRIPERT